MNIQTNRSRCIMQKPMSGKASTSEPLGKAPALVEPSCIPVGCRSFALEDHFYLHVMPTKELRRSKNCALGIPVSRNVRRRN